MKRLLALSLLLLAGPVSAGWTPVAEDGASTTYGDPATVERKGDTATMWTLVDFRAPRRLVEMAYRSQRQQMEFRCNADESRVLHAALLVDAMGSGKIAYEDDSPQDWTRIGADSAIAQLKALACR